MIKLEQKLAIYKTMNVLVEIQEEAWNGIKAKDYDFKCKDAELHEVADKAWWVLQELWKYFN